MSLEASKLFLKERFFYWREVSENKNLDQARADGHQSLCQGTSFQTTTPDNMSKRRIRPWDAGGSFQAKLERAQRALAVPSVRVDGIDFKCDRFYLHAMGDDEPAVGTGDHCRCGSDQPPPLFQREKLVHSLNLRAAILGTFSIDLEWFQNAFPQLIGPSSTIPTLVLHGQKGLSKQLEKETKKATVEDDHGSVREEHSSESPINFRFPCFSPNSSRATDDDISTIDGGSSLKTQEDPVLSPGWKLLTPQRPSVKRNRDVQNILSSNQGAKPQNRSKDASELGQNFHLTQVLSAWLPNQADSKVTHENNDTKDPHLESKRGVHHPKFMLLFETSGDLIIVVSTANLTPTKSVEGSWVQRFRACRRPNSMPSSKQELKNDFGPVLVDFLQKLSESSVQGQTKVDAFLAEYLGLGWKELLLQFHFDKARVHLVPVVPGDWKGKVHKRKQPFLYGRQRVQSIIASQQFPIKHKSDLLLMQPTSFGGSWKRGELADVVRSYMGYTPQKKVYWNDQELLERVKIIWPSKAFIEDTIQPKADTKRDLPENSEHGDSFCFLSSTLFNSCEVSCISRMARYANSNPCQRPTALAPHFKSVARLCRNRDAILNKCCQPADQFFSWFLLTSACFSHGAQGKRSNPVSPISYGNFELGVLFLSQLQPGRGGRKGDRIYCFRPNGCSCQKLGSRLIHLPVPYSLDAQLYFENEEDAVMQETPFLHEIADESRCVGNMLRTPYGLSQQEKKHKKDA